MGWLKSDANEETGELTYTLTAENSRNVHIELHKTDMITGESLQNAVFSLYSDEEHENTVNAVHEIHSDQDGYIDLGIVMDGTYYLAEDSAQAGYIGLSSHVVIIVETDRENGKQVRAMLYSGEAVTYDEESNVYTITVPNNPGVVLPHTGGSGSGIYYLAGSFMVLLAGILLMRRRQNA